MIKIDSPRSASFAANKVKRRAASALFVATVDLTFAHVADTLCASAASSAFARASRTNIAGTRVRDLGSMARCEGECGAGGDDDWLTLAEDPPDDSEDTRGGRGVVRRRVEERGASSRAPSAGAPRGPSRCRTRVPRRADSHTNLEGTPFGPTRPSSPPYARARPPGRASRRVSGWRSGESTRGTRGASACARWYPSSGRCRRRACVCFKVKSAGGA